MPILDQFKLDGQTALVTGCKRGIGKAMAIALAEAGADIVGVSATLETQGSEVEQAVTARGRTFKGYACDFGDRPALYRFITQVKSDFSQIDILINNAGIIIRTPAVEHSDEDWDKVVEVNLSAQFILSREIGKEMVSRGKGKIIFTASLLTFQGGILVPLLGRHVASRTLHSLRRRGSTDVLGSVRRAPGRRQFHRLAPRYSQPFGVSPWSLSNHFS